jgi:hypothetical protein
MSEGVVRRERKSKVVCDRSREIINGHCVGSPEDDYLNLIMSDPKMTEEEKIIVDIRFKDLIVSSATS